MFKNTSMLVVWILGWSIAAGQDDQIPDYLSDYLLPARPLATDQPDATLVTSQLELERLLTLTEPMQGDTEIKKLQRARLKTAFRLRELQADRISTGAGPVEVWLGAMMPTYKRIGDAGLELVDTNEDRIRILTMVRDFARHYEAVLRRRSSLGDTPPEAVLTAQWDLLDAELELAKVKAREDKSLQSAN